MQPDRYFTCSILQSFPLFTQHSLHREIQLQGSFSGKGMTARSALSSCTFSLNRCDDENLSVNDFAVNEEKRCQFRSHVFRERLSKPQKHCESFILLFKSEWKR
jgi:hypothetical protein